MVRPADPLTFTRFQEFVKPHCALRISSVSSAASTSLHVTFRQNGYVLLGRMLRLQRASLGTPPALQDC